MRDLDPGVRYIITDSAPIFFDAPGSGSGAKVAHGQALRVERDAQGDFRRAGNYVRVQPVDAQGRPSGRPGWIDANRIGTGGPSRGMSVRVGNADFVLGSAGRRILEGQCSTGYHQCAVTAQEVGGLPAPIGIAGNYANPRHRNALINHGYDEVRGGDWRPDDVVIWQNSGAGHVGFAAMRNGEWGVVSNLNGQARWHRLGAVSGRVTVWRKRR